MSNGRERKRRGETGGIEEVELGEVDEQERVSGAESLCTTRTGGHQQCGVDQTMDLLCWYHT